MKSDHPLHEGRFLGVNSQAAEQGFRFIASQMVFEKFFFPIFNSHANVNTPSEKL